MQPYSNRIGNVMAAMAPINDFLTNSKWAQAKGDLNSCDFALGNPHEMPLPAFAAALQKWIEPQHKDWFAYKTNEPAARAIIAQSLTTERASDFAAAYARTMQQTPALLIRQPHLVSDLREGA